MQDEMFDSLEGEVARLNRVNREQAALLDRVYQHVDRNGLAKLGQSRVSALIDAHQQAAEAIMVRKLWLICPDCGADIGDGDEHAERCPHFEAEQVARRLISGAKD